MRFAERPPGFRDVAHGSGSDYHRRVVLDMGVTGFDGATKRRLQAEHRNLLKLANQTTTANTTTATYAFAAPSLN